VTTNTGGNGNDKKNKPVRKRKPFYLNWQLWLAVSIGLILTTVGLVLAFGPVAIILPVGAIATIAGSTAGPVIDAWAKVNEKLKEVREKAERAEEKALIQGARNSEIEKKADRAAGAAIALSDRVDVASERTDLLDTRYEVLSDMAYQLTENLQQERAESRLVLAELKAQNHEQQQQINRLKEDHRREISELKEQIRLMGVEKSSDKEKIVKLESQVKQLQDRVKELEDREGKLIAENEGLKKANSELKTGLRRRSTDPLPRLSAENEVRLNQLENEQ
jgi:chromosome segregation ATPase